MLRPLRAPRTVRILMHVEPDVRGAPQALVGGEAVEVVLRERPRDVDLADQGVAGGVGHGWAVRGLVRVTPVV